MSRELACHSAPAPAREHLRTHLTQRLLPLPHHARQLLRLVSHQQNLAEGV